MTVRLPPGAQVSHKLTTRAPPHSHTHTNISTLPTPTLLLLCTNVFRAFSHKQGLQGVPAAFHTTIQVLFWIKAGFYTTAHIDTHKTICVLIFLTLPLMHFFVFRSVDFFLSFVTLLAKQLLNIDPLSQWRDTCSVTNKQVDETSGREISFHLLPTRHHDGSQI